MKKLVTVMGTFLRIPSAVNTVYAGSAQFGELALASMEQADYRLYEINGAKPKYWLKKTSEGVLLIYDDPTMQKPKLEHRDGRIYRPKGFRASGSVEIRTGRIYKRGEQSRFGETRKWESIHPIEMLWKAISRDFRGIRLLWPPSFSIFAAVPRKRR